MITNVTETTEVQNEESSKTDSSANDDSEPVFLERPIRKTEDEEDEGIFGEKTAGSPVKRKIKIAQTNIQINVGNGKSGPDEVSSNKPTAPESSEENSDSKIEKDTPMEETSEDEEKRKRKRSIGADDEVETELKESPPTPTKLQKTE